MTWKQLTKQRSISFLGRVHEAYAPVLM